MTTIPPKIFLSLNSLKYACNQIKLITKPGLIFFLIVLFLFPGFSLCQQSKQESTKAGQIVDSIGSEWIGLGEPGCAITIVWGDEIVFIRGRRLGFIIGDDCPKHQHQKRLRIQRHSEMEVTTCKAD